MYAIYKQLFNEKKRLSIVQKFVFFVIIFSFFLIILESEKNIRSINPFVFEYLNLFLSYFFLTEYSLRLLCCGYNKKYKGFTLENYSSDSEVKIIKDFFNYIESEEKTILFHWGNAEKAYINYIQKRYPEIKIPNIELVDLLYYFKKEPIVIQGIFSFGLKHVAKHLYNHGLIQTTWDDYDNGLDSMIIFQNICQNHSKNIPLKRVYEIKQIIDYNEVDCQVLYEIVSMLKNRYL